LDFLWQPDAEGISMDKRFLLALNYITGYQYVICSQKGAGDR
jgi:hypothetical protein